MRRSHFFSVALVLLLMTTLSADLAYAQRGGGGGGRAPAEIDQETLLEEFDEIVELIWTDEEDDAWGDIDDDDVEAKQAFITAFWERRDPTPGTEDNEFRDVWMQRAALVNQRFRGEGSPGWETDRGKFVMVYGPEVLVAEQRRNVASGGGAESSGGGSVLIWEVDPSQNPFLEDKDEISFAQYQRSYSRSTGVELSEEAFLAGQVVSTYFEARRANPGLAGPGAAPGGAPVATPGAAATAGGAPPTPDRLAMQELMQSGVERSDFGLRQEASFIPAAEGNTYAVVSFDADKSGLTFEADGQPGPASLLAFGVVLKKDPAAPNGEQFLRNIQIPFEVDPGNGTAESTSVHSIGMTLEPGDYRLAWGVMDNASERIATRSYEFTVPDYTAADLAIPSVLVATSMEQKTDEIDVNTVYPATRVGPLELITSLDDEYGRNDSMWLLYFIRGLGVDPSTQQNNYTVTHRILLAGTEESIARLPEQDMNFFAIQQEIPLAMVQQIEPGTDYEIEITITDQVTGNDLTHKVPFHVRGG